MLGLSAPIRNLRVMLRRVVPRILGSGTGPIRRLTIGSRVAITLSHLLLFLKLFKCTHTYFLLNVRFLLIYIILNHLLTQISLPILFLKRTETDLWMSASMIPATVKMPPTMAQMCTKNSKMFSLSCLNYTVMGESS